MRAFIFALMLGVASAFVASPMRATRSVTMSAEAEVSMTTGRQGHHHR